MAKETEKTQKIVHKGVEKELTPEAIKYLKKAGEKVDTVKGEQAAEKETAPKTKK